MIHIETFSENLMESRNGVGCGSLATLPSSPSSKMSAGKMKHDGKTEAILTMESFKMAALFTCTLCH